MVNQLNTSILLLRVTLAGIVATITMYHAVAQFAGGDGSAGDPFQITTLTHLDSIRNHSGGENYLDDHFILMNDLDFDDGNYTYSDAERGWQPIAHDTDDDTNGHQGEDFAGSFNGKGFAIRNVRVNRPNQGYVGLFGRIKKSASIDSLGLEDVNITGKNNVGGLVGEMINNSMVTNSYTSGQVVGSNIDVGGLVGSHNGNAISSSYAACWVEGFGDTGGLVGTSSANIKDSYATGYVTINFDGSNVGGLVGSTFLGCRISRSYVVNHITGGENKGGFVGLHGGDISHSYWNINVSGLLWYQGIGSGDDPAKGDLTRLTTALMDNEDHFHGFSFYDAMNNPTGVWIPPVNNTHFPHLRGVSKNAQVLIFPPFMETGVSLSFFLEKGEDYLLRPPKLYESGGTVEALLELESSDASVATVDDNNEITTIEVDTTMLIFRRAGNADYIPLNLPVSLVVNLFKGSGTAQDPFQISQPQHLDFIRSTYLLSRHYELTSDIDFSDYEYKNATKKWNPIGNYADPFEGTFNGNGFVIRNLEINRPGNANVGLFGHIGHSARIVSIGLENVNIIGNDAVGIVNDAVGGLVGVCRGTIRNSYVHGQVTGNINVGGLVGTNSGNIINSYAYAQVSGIEHVGGLVGYNLDGKIRESYAVCQVKGKETVGGLVGQNEYNLIRNCYSSSQVIGHTIVGSLIGLRRYSEETQYSYAVGSVEGNTDFVGGLEGGWVEGYTTSSYWNIETSGQNLIGGNRGLTTAQMYMESSFENWDFENKWLPPVDGEHFPLLRNVDRNAQVLIIDRRTSIGVGTSHTWDYTILPPTIYEEDGVTEIELTFESTNTELATVNGNVVTAKNNSGTVTINVSRAGNASYAPVHFSLELAVHSFTDGTGEPDDPYQISTPAQLDSIRDYRDNGGENFLDDHYVLTQDLDFLGYDYPDMNKGWLPIAHDTISDNTSFDGTRFTGSFNGKGHVIRNIYTNRLDEDHVGLFGFLDTAGKIDSLGIEETLMNGRHRVGGLAGTNRGNIINAYVTGHATGTDEVGGLVGKNAIDGTIEYSHVIGQVTGTNKVGGLVGTNVETVEYSYGAVQVTGIDEVGGLVGVNDVLENGVIRNAYATGRVEGTNDIGGLVGSNVGTVEYSYASSEVIGSIVGGLVGSNTGPITSGYWNSEIFPSSSTVEGVTALTSEAMYDQSNFKNWDFTNIWVASAEGEHLPLLKEVGGQQYIIIAANGDVEEGEDASFTLTRVGIVSNNELDVHVAIEQVGDFTLTTEATMATFEVGSTNTMLAVPTEDDDIDEPSGTITANIVAAPMEYKYNIGTSNEAVVGVRDNDGDPDPQVSITANNGSVSEGDDALFTLERTNTSGSLQVKVRVEGNGEFVQGILPSDVTFIDGASTALLTVLTEDDNIDELDGSITATLLIGAGYELIDPISATTDIMDNDLPKVTITTNVISVTEGKDVVFTLTRSGTTLNELSVGIDVTQNENGDYIQDIHPSSSVTFMEGALTAILTVTTDDDDMDEDNGIITVKIVDSEGYETGTLSSVSVGISDNDGELDPGVSITANALSVIEGEEVVFELKRTSGLGELSVQVEVTQNGDYIKDTPTSVATFLEGSLTTMFPVTTDDDDLDEANGEIEVTLSLGEGYEVITPRSATTRVMDNDLPTVTIEAVSSSVMEGSSVTYILTRRGNIIDVLSVNLEITQSGEFTTEVGSVMVTFASDEQLTLLAIITEDDLTDEPGGVIMAKVNPGAGYIVGDPSTAEISITDNDGEADPEVSIAAVSSVVTEGADATFTLTRTTMSGALTVNVEVTQQGDYISGTAPTMASFTDGETTATLTVSTDNDDTDELGGVIVATVNLGIGYTVGDPSTAEISITDNDGEADPEVSIVATSSPVVEGMDAVFTLTRTVMSGALTVNVEVTQQGNYISGTAPTMASFVDGETTATLTVSTDNDAIDELSGVIVATVNLGIGYTVGNPSTAEVIITDDDGEADPEVSIAAVSSSVTEGMDATFTLTRTTILGGRLDVNIDVTQQGDYISGAAPTMATFADGETTATLTVSTNDNEVDEEDGIITATVKPSIGYIVAEPSSAEVVVADNDGRRPVGISDKADVVLYPNPVSGQLYVRLPQGGQVSIYTLSGRQKRTYRIHPKQEPVSLNISGLPSGIYVVKLTNATGATKDYKIIKN